MVILDACHSGEAAANPVRPLAPSNQGPIIIASCDRNQSAYEDPKEKKHGLFTYALLEALGNDFNKADVNPSTGVLDPQKIYVYTRKQMPDLLKGIMEKEFAQVPIMFDPSQEKFPLAKKPPK